MEFLKTDIEGLMILRPRVFEDARGYFFESFSQREFDAAVPGVRFVQDNESRSSYGVVRGLHFQKAPHAQGKLTRCVRGRVLDIAMDIREGSATYGKYVAVELSEENHLQFWIPAGFAHGFSVLSDVAVFQYKCDEFYHPETEDGFNPLSPALGIDWQVPAEKMILSDKDRVRRCFEF
jgi:dTDP-4-dehydrorhamnose 3,5-epimerase